MKMTIRKTMVIILIMQIIMKIMDMKVIRSLDETTEDKTMIDVMEITGMVMMQMIAGGKAIGIGTVVGERIIIMKLKIMNVMEMIVTIEEIDQEEIIEVEEMMVMVGTGMVVMILMRNAEDAEETTMDLEKTIMKTNQRKERSIFHQSNLMTKILCLEMT